MLFSLGAGLVAPEAADRLCVGLDGADAGVESLWATVAYACPAAVIAPVGVMKVGRPS
jgi:hypothetical protein